jgi:hypothetical protein
MSADAGDSRARQALHDSPDGQNQCAVRAGPRARRSFGAQNRMRDRSNFACAFRLIWVVQSSAQKYSSFVLSEIDVHFAPFRAGTRGVSRSSRTWCGMRWTDRCHLTSGTDADGEDVWSWRPKGWR